MPAILSRRAAGVAAFAVLLAASPALAAMPPLHVTQTVVIEAPAAKIWAIMGNFADLTWVPAVKHSSATQGNVVGSVRTLDLGGPKLTERLAAYDAAHWDYGYTILPTAANEAVLPVSDYSSTITLSAAGAGKTRVTWSGNFAPAPGKTAAAAVGAITGVYQAGLGNLAKLAVK